MMRRFGVLVFLLSLCLVTQAQSETWQAWLYDSNTLEIMRIDGHGAILQQDTLPLMIPQYGSPVHVSPSGTRMAYVVTQGDHEELIIYDARSAVREIVLQYPLPPLWAETIEFNQFYAQLFSADETHIAFSYVLAEGGWEIIVIDIETGQAVHMLRSGEGFAADLPTQWNELPEMHLPVMPVIRSFEDRAVAFTFRGPDAVGRVSQSYRWDLQANQLISAPAYKVLEMDVYRPTGEIVQSLRWPGVEKEDARIMLYKSGAASDPQIIFTPDLENSVDDPIFIQNGTAIVYKTFTEARWMLNILRRGSSQSELWQPSTTQLAYDIHGTATGFIYTHPGFNADDEDFVKIYEVNTVNGLGEATPIFTLPVEVGYKSRLIWFNDPRLTP